MKLRSMRGVGGCGGVKVMRFEKLKGNYSRQWKICGSTHLLVMIITEVVAVTSWEEGEPKRIVRRLGTTVAFPGEIGGVTLVS